MERVKKCVVTRNASAGECEGKKRRSGERKRERKLKSKRNTGEILFSFSFVLELLPSLKNEYTGEWGRARSGGAKKILKEKRTQGKGKQDELVETRRKSACECGRDGRAGSEGVKRTVKREKEIEKRGKKGYHLVQFPLPSPRVRFGETTANERHSRFRCRLMSLSWSHSSNTWWTTWRLDSQVIAPLLFVP